MKRFYRETGSGARDGGFVVLLDGRPVRTPAKSLLSLPAQGLADAIAAEWDAQAEEVHPEEMPLMRHACMAIDRVAPQRDAVADEIAQYGQTDLLCYRADEPAALAGRQEELWNPLLDWLEESHGVRLAVTSGIMPVAQDAEGLQRLRKVVGAHDSFELAALQTLVSVSGSLVLGLAASVRHLDAAETWRLSRVDHDFQADRWGTDPEAARLAAAAESDLRAATRFLDLIRA